METKTYTTIDRKALGWPSGEWDSEPDKVQWQDEATQLPCLAVRHPHFGNWCGYVGVAPGHQLHGKSCNDADVDVHGGLTYSDKCQPVMNESAGICHIAAPGEPDDVWWLGFDCHHCDDLSISDFMYAERGGIWKLHEGNAYRPLAYVQRENDRQPEDPGTG